MENETFHFGKGQDLEEMELPISATITKFLLVFLRNVQVGEMEFEEFLF